MAFDPDRYGNTFAVTFADSHPDDPAGGVGWFETAHDTSLCFGDEHGELIDGYLVLPGGIRRALAGEQSAVLTARVHEDGSREGSVLEFGRSDDGNLELRFGSGLVALTDRGRFEAALAHVEQSR
jgi:hypothetical protein